MAFSVFFASVWLALVGGYIALMIWDWRKKRAMGRAETPPKPSAEEIKAARGAIAAEHSICGVFGLCGVCPVERLCCNVSNIDRAIAARAWLTERGIPLEEPKA